ncbi:hypothetical protein IC006_2513 [Sulfuracidifex tepidarius]|uniref:Uncharacterized protein n=1 Tax=Sulfuracidifex tepidarius TaxID=1294262 RepID=A0A510DZ31_9CREN|nr:hypothetical protein IC006_2513 [Sulfuracidifex tepidarius]
MLVKTTTGLSQEPQGLHDLEDEEARLIVKGDNAFLKVVFDKPLERDEPRESVAVDVNMGEVVVGRDDKRYVRIPTRLEVHHCKSLAERLQKYQRGGGRIRGSSTGLTPST